MQKIVFPASRCGLFCSWGANCITTIRASLVMLARAKKFASVGVCARAHVCVCVWVAGFSTAQMFPGVRLWNLIRQERNFISSIYCICFSASALFPSSSPSLSEECICLTISLLLLLVCIRNPSVLPVLEFTLNNSVKQMHDCSQFLHELWMPNASNGSEAIQVIQRLPKYDPMRRSVNGASHTLCTEQQLVRIYTAVGDLNKPTGSKLDCFFFCIW